METLATVEYGVARFTLPGEAESGDLYLVCGHEDGLLLAVVDGLGHGQLAASAAKAASSLLEMNADEPIITLVERCHELLKSSRGVVLSLASIDLRHGLMTWLGIGNVQGLLMRSVPGQKGNAQEFLLLRAGVVGSQLPPLQASVLPVAQDDTVIFCTDGIRSDFMEALSPRENPQKAADRILESYCTRNDDALVLVARWKGSLT